MSSEDGDFSLGTLLTALKTAAKLIVVHELVRDPLLRREARRYYLDYAVVNVTPTDKGRSKIDELNPAYVSGALTLTGVHRS